MKLNENEKKVLKLLHDNPYINQKDLAELVNVSRPAVGNIISGLQQKGYILGKPYMLRQVDYLTCIGGANIDVTFNLEDEFMLGTSNPVVSKTSNGGVIRNVAENLARLDQHVSLMTLVGDDNFGEDLLVQSRKLMETFASEKVKDETTGSYYSIIDIHGDMKVGFADMSINRLMNRTWILEHKKHLHMSAWMITDLNVTKEAVDALIEFSRQSDIPLAIIGVSSPKMKHLSDDLSDVDLVICNKDESQTYFKTSEERVELLCQMWLDAGVKKAVITAGTKGAYYGEHGVVKHQEAFIIPEDKVVDVTGAGDAFSSATIYGLSTGKSLEESVKMGALNSSLTIQVPYAVNPKLSMNLLKKELKKYENK